MSAMNNRCPGLSIAGKGLAKENYIMPKDPSEHDASFARLIDWGDSLLSEVEATIAAGRRAFNKNCLNSRKFQKTNPKGLL